MLACQGFSELDVPWQAAGLTPTQIGGMIGNAQSFNVVRALVPHVLFHARLITKDQYEQVKGLWL